MQSEPSKSFSTNVDTRAPDHDRTAFTLFNDSLHMPPIHTPTLLRSAILWCHQAHFLSCNKLDVGEAHLQFGRDEVVVSMDFGRCHTGPCLRRTTALTTYDKTKNTFFLPGECADHLTSKFSLCEIYSFLRRISSRDKSRVSTPDSQITSI